MTNAHLLRRDLNVSEIDEEMVFGKRPQHLKPRNVAAAGGKLILVHGYCAAGNPFEPNAYEFQDALFFKVRARVFIQPLLTHFRIQAPASLTMRLQTRSPSLLRSREPRLSVLSPTLKEALPRLRCTTTTGRHSKMLSVDGSSSLSARPTSAQALQDLLLRSAASLASVRHCHS